VIEVNPETSTASGYVRLRGGSVSIGGRTLWGGLDLDLGPGQFAAVLGPNGVGKSTLIRTLLGQQALSAGALEVLGAPAGRRNDQIGYLPQRRSFDAGTRIRGIDVVRLGYDGPRFGLPLPFGERSRQARAAVRDVLDLVGGTHLAQRPIGQMSGGEQQRLLIAQALVRKPQLLLLDEPLDSLDLPNQAAIASLISTVCREQGVTVVMVAHDVNPVLRYLDTVLYLAAGGVAVGPPDEVITGARLSALFQTPIEVLRASDGRLVVVGSPEAPAHHHDRHELR
jgi:zinc/manganese transport system ATP-binding protein